MTLHFNLMTESTPQATVFEQGVKRCFGNTCSYMSRIVSRGQMRTERSTVQEARTSPAKLGYIHIRRM